MPMPVLGDSTQPITADAPDLRGLWKVVDVRSAEGSLPDDHPIWDHVERIEQSADRLVITGGGVIHDMYVDGSYENGVNDVMAADFATPIVVAATYEGGALVLRPRDFPGVEVRRWRDGGQMIWAYHSAFTATLEPVDI
jgi:hypothetical protein